MARYTETTPDNKTQRLIMQAYRDAFFAGVNCAMRDNDPDTQMAIKRLDYIKRKFGKA